MVYFVGERGDEHLIPYYAIGTAREIQAYFDRKYPGGRSRYKARVERQYDGPLGSIEVREMEGDEATAAAIRAQLAHLGLYGYPWEIEFSGPEVLAFVDAHTLRWSGEDALALGVRYPKPIQDHPVPIAAGLAGRLGRRR